MNNRKWRPAQMAQILNFSAVLLSGFLILAVPAPAQGKNLAAVPEDKYWSDMFGYKGLTGTVSALVGDGQENIYAGGSFATAGGMVVNKIAKGNGTSWSPLGSGIDTAANSGVSALALDSSGNLYVGGNFTTAGGVTVSNVAKWDGANWSALGTGVAAPGVVFALACDKVGNLYAGGEL